MTLGVQSGKRVVVEGVSPKVPKKALRAVNSRSEVCVGGDCPWHGSCLMGGTWRLFSAEAWAAMGGREERREGCAAVTAVM